MKALIVENEYTGRLLLKEFLKNYGTIHFAGNGAEAVATVREALGKNERFDLICMDVMMPELDGYEAMKQIRDLEERHGISPPQGAKIIVTTVLSEKLNAFASKAPAGLCNAYVVKPIKKQDFDDKLRDLGLIA